MSATFGITRDQCITAALQVCQVLAKTEVADATDLADCSIYLGALLKKWDDAGYKCWLYETFTFPWVAAKVSYTIGEAAADVIHARPVRIPLAYSIDANNNKTWLNGPMSQFDFERLTPKSTPGIPNSYKYDPQLVKGVFYPWPVPTDTSQSFGLLVQRPINDITTGAGTFDILQEGYLALIWSLAELIMLPYGVPARDRQEIRQMAQSFRDDFLNFAEEDAGTTFMPDSRVGGTRRG